MTVSRDGTAAHRGPRLKSDRWLSRCRRKGESTKLLGRAIDRTMCALTPTGRRKCTALHRLHREATRQRECGVIINTSSVAGETAPPGMLGYPATKVALIGMTLPCERARRPRHPGEHHRRRWLRHAFSASPDVRPPLGRSGSSPTRGWAEAKSSWRCARTSSKTAFTTATRPSTPATESHHDRQRCADHGVGPSCRDARAHAFPPRN